MPNFRVIFLSIFIITLNFNVGYTIEKPPSPFAKKDENIQDANATTGNTMQKQEFVRFKNITIATYPSTENIGKIICSLINYNQQKVGFKCSTKQTEGSIENVYELNNGNVDFAIISSNIVHDKLQANDADTGENNVIAKYSFVLSLYSEVLNILVKDDSDIKSIKDIKDKILDVGNHNSTNSYVLHKILEAQNWSNQDFKGIEYISNENKVDAFCAGKIDVTLIYAGTPNGLVNQITQSCSTRIIPIEEDLVKQLSSSNPFINQEVIPEGTYLGNPMNIDTFGTPALIVTTSDFDNLVVYNLAKIILQNIHVLSKLHPAFKVHPLKSLANNKGLIPYHEGVAILFREERLISE